MELSLAVDEKQPLQPSNTHDIEYGAASPSSPVSPDAGAPPPASNQESLEAYRERTKDVRKKHCCSMCIDWYILTCFAHRFHCTEVFCLLAFGLCVVLGVFVITGDVIPPYAYSILLAIYSLFSLAFVWGYVKISSLAAIATRLENLARRGTVELEKYRVINKSLDNQADTYKNQLGQLGDETSAIDSETNALNALLPKLEEMQKKHEEMNQVQIELGDKEDQYAREQSLAVEDKKKEVMKAALRVQFETFNRVPGREGAYINDDITTAKVKDFFLENEVDITHDLDVILQAKVLYMHHLISYIDEKCNTRFFRLKFASETTRQKEREVDKMRKKRDERAIKYAKELKKLGDN